MSAPSADRTVQILDLLTTHPGRGFTLSELSRQLLMNKATASRVLTVLTAHGLLMRHPTTHEFRLGPALIPMGAVAQRSFPALEEAKPVAEALANEVGTECIILMLTGEEILIIGRAGKPGPLSFASFEGTRHPLLPPLGTFFLAWRSDQAVEEWLARSGDDLSDEERHYFREAVVADRERGYSVGLRVPGVFGLTDLYAAGNFSTPQGRHKIREAYAALAHDRDYLVVTDDVPPDAELQYIAAPVFGPDGAMLFAVCLLLQGEPYLGRDVPRLARMLTHAAGRVTRAVDGVPPVANGRPALNGQTTSSPT